MADVVGAWPESRSVAGVAQQVSARLATAAVNVTANRAPARGHPIDGNVARKSSVKP